MFMTLFGFWIHNLSSRFIKEDPYLMTRKNFYKVLFMTADELFFLFFTHALPLSPTPQRTYVRRLSPNFS